MARAAREKRSSSPGAAKPYVRLLPATSTPGAPGSIRCGDPCAGWIGGSTCRCRGSGRPWAGDRPRYRRLDLVGERSLPAHDPCSPACARRSPREAFVVSAISGLGARGEGRSRQARAGSRCAYLGRARVIVPGASCQPLDPRDALESTLLPGALHRDLPSISLCCRAAWEYPSSHRLVGSAGRIARDDDLVEKDHRCPT